MPETRAERVMFALGLAIIGVLVAVVVLGRHPSERAASATPTTARNRTVALTSTSVQTTGGATTTTPPATTTVATPPSTSSQASLQVTATTDTWLSVRRDTASGDVLFEGTLASGDSRSFSAAKFAVRFGAAANVRARLNGKPLKLPGGTYSATITPAGLGPRSA